MVLGDHSILFEPDGLPLDACRNPDDVAVLGLAVASEADGIVTGDKDLLDLKEYGSIPILTPRGFWEIVHDDRP